MVSRNRRQEEFREQLRRSITPDDMRLMSEDSLARVADPEAVNRFRESIYRQQSRGVARMVRSTGEEADMEKLRARRGTYHADVVDMALEDNVCLIYFNTYGENFEGGSVMDDPEKGWTCPGCKIKYRTSLKSLPDRCMRCGWQSPMGRLRKDGFLRR